MSTTASIYRIPTPKGNYYGSTNTTLSSRMEKHRYRAKTEAKTPICVAMREMGVKNVQIELVKICLDGEDRVIEERKQIQLARDRGETLLNVHMLQTADEIKINRREYNLERLQRNKSSGRHRCNDCDYNFATNTCLKKHLETKNHSVRSNSVTRIQIVDEVKLQELKEAVPRKKINDHQEQNPKLQLTQTQNDVKENLRLRQNKAQQVCQRRNKSSGRFRCNDCNINCKNNYDLKNHLETKRHSTISNSVNSNKKIKLDKETEGALMWLD